MTPEVRQTSATLAAQLYADAFINYCADDESDPLNLSRGAEEFTRVVNAPVTSIVGDFYRDMREYVEHDLHDLDALLRRFQRIDGSWDDWARAGVAGKHFADFLVAKAQMAFLASVSGLQGTAEQLTGLVKGLVEALVYALSSGGTLGIAPHFHARFADDDAPDYAEQVFQMYSAM